MGWFTGLVLFALIWWTVLFAVLPFGAKPVDVDKAAGGWRGAPERPLLWRKLLATTLITAVLWSGAVAVIRSPLFSFRDMAARMPDD